MGRSTTGSITVNEAMRLDINYLRKKSVIVPGQAREGVMKWTNGASVHLLSHLMNEDFYIRLKYRYTSYDGEVKNYDYKIYLTTVPSNLGIGEIYYFICPVDYCRCRILYNCYYSGIWKSRTAYHNRIYYPSQESSKYSYYNDRYWATNKQLDELYPQVVKTHYRGNKTRLQQRIERLEEKQEEYDYLRWSIMPKSIEKMFKEYGRRF